MPCACSLPNPLPLAMLSMGMTPSPYGTTEREYALFEEGTR